MIIDCGTCEVAGPACDDCVVTVLLGPPGVLGVVDPRDRLDPAGRGEVEVADDHAAAMAVLAKSGLVPPLRLVPRVAS